MLNSPKNTLDFKNCELLQILADLDHRPSIDFHDPVPIFCLGSARFQQGLRLQKPMRGDKRNRDSPPMYGCNVAATETGRRGIKMSIEPHRLAVRIFLRSSSPIRSLLTRNFRLAYIFAGAYSDFRYSKRNLRKQYTHTMENVSHRYCTFENIYLVNPCVSCTLTNVNLVPQIFLLNFLLSFLC